MGKRGRQNRAQNKGKGKGKKGRRNIVAHRVAGIIYAGIFALTVFLSLSVLQSAIEGVRFINFLYTLGGIMSYADTTIGVTILVLLIGIAVSGD